MSGSVQLPNWNATNALLDLPGVMGAAQQYKQNALALDNAQMQNDLQHVLQPLQVEGQRQSTQDMLDAMTAARRATQSNPLSGLGPVSDASGSQPDAIAATGGAALPVAAFEQKLAGRESGGNASIVNSEGYLGRDQMGAPRMASLGIYTPAPGEIDPKTGAWNHQTNGTFNIPGHPEVRTKQDFLNSDPAQRAAFAVHVGDIDRTIASTPGADRFDVNGLRAVAHLGGTGVLRPFVASGGRLNRADSNGTTLVSYYNQFAGPSGASALQAAYGHPDGPPNPRQYASNVNPNVQSDAPGFAGRALAAQLGAQPDGSDPSAQGQPSPNQQVAALGPQYVPQGGGVNPQDAASAAAAAAQAARIKLLQNNAFFQSGGKGMDAVAKLQNSMDSMAKEGVVILPNGSVGVLPGAVAGKQAMSQADAQGKVQPEVDKAAAIALNAQQIKRNDLVKASPGETFTTERAALANAGQTSTGMLTLPGGRGTPIKDESGRQGVYDNATQTVHWLSGPDTRPMTDKIAEQDYAQIPALAKQAQGLEGAIQKSIEARNAAAEVPTGSNSDARAARANWVKTYFPDIADKLIDSGALQDPTKAQIAKKLLFSQATTDEQSFGGSGGLGITQKFEGANPNLDMTGEGIRQMSNLKAMTALANKDYLEGKINHITDQNQTHYTPGSTAPYLNAGQYDKKWLSQNNANVYMAAIDAMNGKPFAEWSKNLTDPADIQRALGKISRIDPSAVVNGQHGQLSLRPPAAPGQAAPQRQSPATAPAPAVPAVGAIMQGHRFLGGDPSKPASWQAVQ